MDKKQRKEYDNGYDDALRALAHYIEEEEKNKDQQNQQGKQDQQDQQGQDGQQGQDQQGQGQDQQGQNGQQQNGQNGKSGQGGQQQSGQEGGQEGEGNGEGQESGKGGQSGQQGQDGQGSGNGNQQGQDGNGGFDDPSKRDSNLSDAEKAVKGDKDGEGENKNKNIEEPGQQQNGQKQGGQKPGQRQGQQNGQQQNGQQGQDNKGQGHAQNARHLMSPEEVKAAAQKVIDAYKNRMSGPLGKFIQKCKTAAKLNDGISMGVTKGSTRWNEDAFNAINTYIKQRVFAKKRMFKRTFKKWKRGAAMPTANQPIFKGKQVKDEHITLKMSFFIDVSGSMRDCIDKVVVTANGIADGLDNKYRREKIIDERLFDFYTFNDDIKKSKRHQSMIANGDTCNFDKIVDYIAKNTPDSLINVILTDAEFEVHDAEIEKILETGDNLLVVIVNKHSASLENLAKKRKDGRIVYIEADADFTINEKLLK